ncbi:hypothetical protein EJ03DRAFT_367238 [Teratosphaeria nubilosa]|uniref:UDP-glucose/GDP-mannose dehydrogenase dimerisation domain-containing protein n=1 Tax=Teratosphaeria nubilosa TaxID=161662 RepID=A0A6G1L1H2_9PEZI|nr:hypothetical protein EJ03DRAFT_367238 [Teratosphaeria nubilosa]
MGGMNAAYSQAFRTVIRVSKPEVAEMTKLVENCYRMINSAYMYVNKVAGACRKQDISVDELVQAAFQSFQPGLINPLNLMAINELPLLRQPTENTWARPVMQAREFWRNAKRPVRPVGCLSLVWDLSLVNESLIVRRWLPSRMN